MNSRRIRAAKPALGFERECHPYCLSCGEVITHPLCQECIARSFFSWISMDHREQRSILRNLPKFRMFDGVMGLSYPRCISCWKKRVYVCPYCFTSHLYKIIKEAGGGVRMLTEFLFIFNFDFEHKGYYQDLEALGGY